MFPFLLMVLKKLQLQALSCSSCFFPFFSTEFWAQCNKASLKALFFECNTGWILRRLCQWDGDKLINTFGP